MIYVYAEIANDYLMHASSGMEYICVRWAKIICKYLREIFFAPFIAPLQEEFFIKINKRLNNFSHLFGWLVGWLKYN